jgi:hypothetical protein
MTWRALSARPYGVVGSIVRVRRYKTYAPCALDPTTGVDVVPTVTQYGDGLCDPGLTAYDTKTERVTTTDVATTVTTDVTTNVTLTQDVLSCPPPLCDYVALEQCAEHLYSVKGLQGCIDTGASEGTAFDVEFTVRDDALPPHITRVVRRVVVDAACPAGFTYCPEVDPAQACQTQVVCDNAALLAALASADEVVADVQPPEITMYVPKLSVHEYGSVYIQPGATTSPFAPCSDAAARATAASLKAAGRGWGSLVHFSAQPMPFVGTSLTH